MFTHCEHHEIFTTSLKFYHELFILEQNSKNHESFLPRKFGFSLCKATVMLNECIGHSRTIIGLEQSQSDSDKIFLLLLDSLKDKKDILKIKSSSCGNAVHRYMRRSVRQETHHQYELVFINGLLLDAKEKEVS